MQNSPPGLAPLLLWLLGLAMAGAVCADGNPPNIDFMLHCQGCHLPGGAGVPGHVPALHGQVAKFLHSSEGRAYLLRVPGVAQSVLSDQKLADVMNWMLREFDPQDMPANFTPYDSAEVAHWRQQILRNVNAQRSRILEDAGFAPDPLY